MASSAFAANLSGLFSETFTCVTGMRNSVLISERARRTSIRPWTTLRMMLPMAAAVSGGTREGSTPASLKKASQSNGLAALDESDARRFGVAGCARCMVDALFGAAGALEAGAL